MPEPMSEEELARIEEEHAVRMGPPRYGDFSRDALALIAEVRRLRAELAASNVCEICQVCLDPMPPRCEMHANAEKVECEVCGEVCTEENYTQDGYPACSPGCALHEKCDVCGLFKVGAVCLACLDSEDRDHGEG